MSILVILAASVIPAVVSSRRNKAAEAVPELPLEEVPFDIPEPAEEAAQETVTASEEVTGSGTSAPEEAAEDTPAADAGEEPR